MFHISSTREHGIKVEDEVLVHNVCRNDEMRNMEWGVFGETRKNEFNDRNYIGNKIKTSECEVIKIKLYTR